MISGECGDGGAFTVGDRATADWLMSGGVSGLEKDSYLQLKPSIIAAFEEFADDAEATTEIISYCSQQGLSEIQVRYLYELATRSPEIIKNKN